MAVLTRSLSSHPRAFAALGVVLLAALAWFVLLAPSDPDAGGDQAMQGPPPATVTIDRVESAALTPSFTAPGDIVADRDSVVAAEVSGRVRSTLPIGAPVSAGSVIAVIDDRDARMALSSAVAEIARLEAQRGLAEARLGRLEQLVARGFATQADLDEAVSGRDQAVSQIAAAQIARDTMQLALSRTRVVSPFAGQVAERMIEVGEYATPGREIARIVGRDGAEARVRVPISVAGNLAAGQEVSILNDGREQTTRIRTVIETGDDVSRTLEVRAPLALAEGRVGGAISMTVPTGILRTVTTVPRDALVLRESGIFVYIINSESDAGESGEDAPADQRTARRVDVTVGQAQGDRIEVSGDLAAGDLVVVRGGERLRDGQAVVFDAPDEAVARSATRPNRARARG